MLTSAAKYLVVDEGKSGDEVVKAVESGLSEVLAIVTEELEDGKHGKTSVLELSGLTLGKDVIGEVKLSGGGAVETVVLNTSNGSDDLNPSEEGDGVDGSDTVGDTVGAEATGGEVVSESVSLRGDVSEDGKHAHTAVLEFSKTVLVELLLADAVRKTSGIPESSRGKSSNLVLERLNRGGRASNLGRGEGNSRAGEGSEDGELHFDLLEYARCTEKRADFE